MNGSPATSGRAASLARRQALSTSGATSRPSSVTASTAPPRAAGGSGQPLSGRELSLARRRALNGTSPDPTPMAAPAKASVYQEPVKPAPVAAAPVSMTERAPVDTVALEAVEAQDILSTVCDIIERDSEALGAGAASVRQLCRQRRQALSNQGKSALPPSSPARSRDTRSLAGGSAGSVISVREQARQIRASSCEHGRGNSASARPSGRVRPTPAPVKVETGTTLSGNSVTGTQVERTQRVTGNEASTCRHVTGTEYLGLEQHEQFCSTPAPAPRAAKVVMSLTARRQGISGVDEARDGAVTGSETGRSRAITGTDYSDLAPKSTTAPQAPAKVPLTHTLRGTTVSGTAVGHSSQVSGDDRGTCKSVTGTEYISNEQFASFCRAQPEMPPAKVAADRTWRGQTVSGTDTDSTSHVTGDEPGVCQVVTGSSYTGRARFERECGPDRTSEQASRTPQRRATPAMPLTGMAPGPDLKVSGTMNRGAALAISGSPYFGGDDLKRQGISVRPLPDHHRAQAPMNTALPMSAAVVAAAPTPDRSFSIVSPARQAADRASLITGTAYAATGRITGPVNLADGLVSGTPEFRRRDGLNPAVAVATVPYNNFPAEVSKPVRKSISGDGNDAGKRITGDDWGRSERVTGTEGAWAAGRNPTQRGSSTPLVAMARPAAAQPVKEVKPQEAPQRVTGSSGNTQAGARITLSGGARA